MKKIEFSDVIKIFESNGCKLLSKTYVNAVSKLDYVASCGHRSQIRLADLKNGHGIICKKCALLDGAKKRKRTTDDVKMIFESTGCKCINLLEYKDNKTKIRYICLCGHESSCSLNDFIRHKENKVVCPTCNRKARGLLQTKSIDEIKTAFSNAGCKLLSLNYNGNRQKLEYVATCGHKSTITFNDFSQGHGLECPHCARNRLSERVVEAILTKHFDVKHEYKIVYNDESYGFLDFFIPSKSLAIEFNGKQHYEWTPRFHPSTADFLNQRHRDEKKREYCKARGIRLIEIDGRRWNYKNITEDYILSLIGITS